MYCGSRVLEVSLCYRLTFPGKASPTATHHGLCRGCGGNHRG